MKSTFFFDEIDIEALTKLILRSQQLTSRKALCLRIGIEPNLLGFINDPSDNDFVIQLIDYLNKIKDPTPFCKLCCHVLFPIFRNSTDRHILEEIIAKLNCNCNELKSNVSIGSIPPDGVKPKSRITKIVNVSKNILVGGAILLVGLPLYNYLTVTEEPNNQQILRGTVEEVVNGDLMCYITMSTEDGRFTLGASFDLCEQKWVNQKVSVKAKPERVNDCESADPCGRTKDMLLITSMSKRY